MTTVWTFLASTGVGGIIGAIGTGIFTAPSLGGIGGAAFALLAQTLIQTKAVVITVIWSGVVSMVLFKLLDMTIGLRVNAEAESVGLDLSAHGEAAYHS